MAKLRTFLFVLLTIAEIIISKSPPANEDKEKEPRLAYFLGSRSTARAPARRSVDIQDYALALPVDLVKNVVSKTVDKEHNNGTGLMKKNVTSRHCDHCKCTQHKLLQNLTATFGRTDKTKNRRDTPGRSEHPLNEKNTQKQQQITIKEPSIWTTINPTKVKSASSSEVNPPTSKTDVKLSGRTSEVPLVSSTRVRDNTPAGSVVQTQLREEEDEEDASDYQDPVARLSHSIRN